MKTKLSTAVSVLFAAVMFAGCGPSREEIERRERERLELEKQAQREIQKSNEAVNEVSKKLGRKPPSLDLGVPPATRTEPAPDTEKKR